MSVMMTMWAKGDPNKLEEFAARESDAMRAIADQAKEHGLIAHRFYGSDDGQIMVVDEWPDEQSFQSFYQAQQEPIGRMMQEVGVSSEPQTRFWRKLETHDEVGWGAEG
jgi:heme-degrading monooxygenase HmoA